MISTSAIASTVANTAHYKYKLHYYLNNITYYSKHTIFIILYTILLLIPLCNYYYK